MEKDIKVAFLGTGLMGAPMAARVAAAGYPLTVYNRTRARAEPLAQSGAKVVDSPAKAISNADCVVLMLTDAAAIKILLLDEARTVLANRTIIQMSTIAPRESMAIANEVAAAGGDYLEAPVLGSIPEAQAGKLIVMVGGQAEQFRQWHSLLGCFSANPRYIGAVGQAAAVKLALNQLIAALTAAFCLSLGFVQNNGVDVNLFMEILRESALYAPTFDKKLKRYLERDYANANFPTKHLTKDIALLLGEAGTLDTSALAGVFELLQETMMRGFGDADYSAIYEAIAPKKEE